MKYELAVFTLKAMIGAVATIVAGVGSTWLVITFVPDDFSTQLVRMIDILERLSMAAESYTK